MNHPATPPSGHDREDATELGTIVRGWQIERPLRRGPVCSSWLASKGEESAVIRVLRAPFATSDETRREWLRANWAANRFHHARVLKVIEQGVDDRGRPLIVRRWADGESLEEAVSRGGLAGKLALRLTEQILDALEMAHAHGIVHGALSPSNVVVTRRRSIRLVDFATTPELRETGGRESEALALARLGPYTPPEGHRSPPAPPSEQWDIWSVGACLYFAIAGASPPDMLQGLPAFPGSTDVAAVIAHALARDPLDRYESAYAMLGDVRRLIAGRKPKLDGAMAPVPSSRVGQVPERTTASSILPPPPLEPPKNETPRAEWRGNLLLMVAISLLVGVATFVMVRERLAEEPSTATHSISR